MSLPIYKQYCLPPVNVFDGQLEFRINTDGSLLYDRVTPATETLFVDPPSVIINVAELKKQFNDKDGDLSADAFKFNVYDLIAYSGREGDPFTGTQVSENLGATNSSLWDKICFNENTVQLVCFATLRKSDGTRETFFIGKIDPLQIPRTHLSVWFANTVNEVQTRELELNAVDIMTVLKTITVQDILGVPGNELLANHASVVDYWYSGIRWDAPSLGQISQASYYDGGVGHLTDPNTGLRDLTLSTILDAIAAEMGATFSGTLDSSFDAYTQTYNGTDYALTKYAGSFGSLGILGNHYFGKGIFDSPRITVSSVDTATYTLTTSGAHGYAADLPVRFIAAGGGSALPSPLVAGTTYYIINPTSNTFQVSATVGGAAINLTTAGFPTILVYDFTGDFPYKNAWDRTMPVTDILRKISFQLGTIFYTDIDQIFKSPIITTISRRTKFGNIPASWQLVNSKEEPHYITQTAVQVTNENDDLKLQAGIVAQNEQALEVSIPWRGHQWGDQVLNKKDTDSLVPDAAKWFDQSLGQWEQWKCFTTYIDGSNPPENDADAWQGSRFLFTHLADVTGIYHRPAWATGHAGMVNIAAWTIKGSPVPGDNDDFYNSLKAHAIFYYQELIGNKIILSRKYSGVLAEDGTVRSVRPGLETVLPIRIESNGGLNRTFRAIETSQDFMSGTTECKFMERPSDYTLATIPPLQYVTQAGGTSSTGASSSTSATNSSTSATISQWTDIHKIEKRTVNFYSNGVVSRSLVMSVVEWLDSANEKIVAVKGFSVEYDSGTPPYGHNDEFSFKLKETEHGNVEIVGLSPAGVPDYWAKSSSMSKTDVLGTNTNVYEWEKHRAWSEDSNTFLTQNILGCTHPNRRVFVKGRFSMSWAGAGGFGLATWATMADPLIPMSDRELLSARRTAPFTASGFDVVYLSAVNPIVTPAGTDGIQVDFGERMFPVAIDAQAWKIDLGTPTKTGAYYLFPEPVENGRDNAGANISSILLKFGLLNFGGAAGPPPTYVLNYANNAELDAAFTENAGGWSIVVDLWGLCEIKGEDATTS